MTTPNDSPSAGIETRRKKPVRGIYTDPSPGMYDVKGSFERAADKGAKIAAVAGRNAALREAGLLRPDHPAPHEGVTEIFKGHDFGLPLKKEDLPGRPSGHNVSEMYHRAPHSTAGRVVTRGYFNE